MKIAVIGGAREACTLALAKQLGPHHEVTVWERNAPDDTFGFGVVFSDETLGGIEHADRAVYAAMERSSPGGTTSTSTTAARCSPAAPRFAAMSRKRLLEILQQRCRDLGVTLHFLTEAPDVEELSPHPRPGAGRRRPQLHGPAPLPGHLPPDARRAGSASTCGSAPPRCSTPSRSTSSTPRTASCRCTATPSTTRAPPSSSRCTRTSGGRGFDAFADRDWRLGDSDEKSIEQVEGDLRRHPRRPRGHGATTRGGSRSPPSATSTGAMATSSSSATPPTPPTSPSGPAPSSPWRTPSPSRPACTSTTASTRR